MNEFDKLLGELDLLTKALPAEDAAADKKIEAAAEEGAAAGEDKVDGEDKPLEKSFVVKLADGSEMEAQDGTELIKALTARVDTAESNLLKALTQSVSLIKSQGAQMVALEARVQALSTQGAGRKTVVSITERPTAAEQLKKSDADADGVKPDVFMAKALTQFKAGKISGDDLSLAEACVNRNQKVPDRIVSAVLS